jgi:hypothetical protein
MVSLQSLSEQFGIEKGMQACKKEERTVKREEGY